MGTGLSFLRRKLDQFGTLLENTSSARLLTALAIWLLVWTFALFPPILKNSSMKSDDSFDYVTSAYNIYDGKGMRLGAEYNYHETAYWAPLVPYTIAWTSKLVGFKTITPMKLLNVFLVIVSCSCLIRFGSLLRNGAAGKLAAILWCFYVPLLTYVGRVNYTVVNACLFVALLLAVVSYFTHPTWYRLFTIGIVQTLMFYNLGTSLFLIPFLLLVIVATGWFTRQEKRLSLYLLVPWAVALLSTTPWVLRNYRIFHRPIFIQMSGYTVYEGNKATKHFFDDPWSYGQTEPMIHREYIGPAMKELGVTTYEEWDLYSYKLGLQEILNDPLLQLEKIAIMSVAFWYFAMTPFHSLIYAAYAIPLIAGFVIYLRRQEIPFSMRIAIICSSYFYLFCIMTTAQARYSLPCIPALMLCFSTVVLAWRKSRVGPDESMS